MQKWYSNETMNGYSVEFDLFKSYRQDMLSTARIEHLVQRGGPSWFGAVMSRLGDALVFFGNWLKTHYAIKPVYPAR